MCGGNAHTPRPPTSQAAKRGVRAFQRARRVWARQLTRRSAGRSDGHGSMWGDLLPIAHAAGAPRAARSETSPRVRRGARGLRVRTHKPHTSHCSHLTGCGLCTGTWQCQWQTRRRRGAPPLRPPPARRAGPPRATVTPGLCVCTETETGGRLGRGGALSTVGAAEANKAGIVSYDT